MGRYSKLSSVALAYYNYLAVFSFYFTAVLSSIFSFLSYKMLAMVLAVVTAFIVIANFRGGNKKGIIRTIVPMAFVVFLFAFGTAFYPSSSFPDSATLHQSELLALAGQVVPAMLLAVVVSKKKECQYEMMRATPLIGFLLSVVAIRTVLNPAEVNASGYVAVEGGLNYQNVAYMGAYAFAFLGYYIVCYNKIEWPKIFKFFLVRYFLYGLFFAVFVIVILSGGRGGFVVLGFHSLLFIYMYFRKTTIERKKAKKFFFIILLVILAFVIFSLIQRVSADFAALERITGMFGGDGDTGRENLRTMALQSFSESPILGYGFGSVFFAIGDYSHNIFTDIMVETGIVGLLVFLYILFKAGKSMIKSSNETIIDYLWLVIFIDGFGQALFSGYYLANIPLWWSIAFALCGRRVAPKREQINIEDVVSLSNKK